MAALAVAAFLAAALLGCVRPTPQQAGSTQPILAEPVSVTPSVERLVASINRNPQLRADVEMLLQQRFSAAGPVDLREMAGAIQRSFQPRDIAFADLVSARFMLLPLSHSPEGRRVLGSPEVHAWFHDFLVARKEFMDSRESASLVPFLQNLSWEGPPDYVTPPGGFQSLNAFFTRTLRPGARPIASPDDDTIAAAPVDGKAKLLAMRAGTNDITVKDGATLDVAKMLTGSSYADRFRDGAVFGFLLDINNYHHFHAPVGGKIVERKDAAGNYLSVWLAPAFAVEQYRAHYVIETPQHGLVALVAFGMSVVESVNLTAHPGDTIRKGDDLGHFAYGGSYVAVVFERGVEPSDSLRRKGPPELMAGGVPVKLGSQIASFR
jgi:phosphatidylserine decarboxylase